MKTILIAIVLVLLLAVIALFTVVPIYVDAQFNPVEQSGPYTASDEAQRLHKRLVIADLHADPLLWSRNLLKRSGRGHVDVPRLIEGNVALQTFAAVTKSPWSQNYEGNTGDSDRITPLAVVQRWPIRTWKSLKERALYQAEKLHKVAARSEGTFTVIQSAKDLERYLARRAQEPNITAGLLAVEGLHCLEGDLANVDVLFDAGYRMMSTTHFFDNELGGSAHGAEKGRLTPFGRQVIQRMQERGIVVDLAHVAPLAVDDILGLTTGPVLVSHSGVQGTCPGPRNLKDRHIRHIAQRDGVIGIGFWEGAVCGTEPEAIVRAMRYVADLVGVDHIALGSDYDGTVLTAFDTSGLVLLTEALLEDGFTEEDIEQIMGGNVMRLLAQTLPRE